MCIWGCLVIWTHVLRFMICCDRCEEWFHGDCVGITEARGRLMERNGEDYVCPNCSMHKGQISKAGSSAAAAENGKRPASGPRKAEPSPATSSTAAVSTEEKTADDLGIKGRIEKAANPSGKKKIKIFQPVCCNMNRESTHRRLFVCCFISLTNLTLVRNAVFDLFVCDAYILIAHRFLLLDIICKLQFNSNCKLLVIL